MNINIHYYATIIPDSWLLISLITIGIGVVVSSFKFKVSLCVSMGLLAEYYFLLLCLTVFCRPCTEQHQWQLIPFIRYVEYCHTEIPFFKRVMLQEFLMNVAAFVPIGFLVSSLWFQVSSESTNGRTEKYISLKNVLIVSLFLSSIIELLQLSLCRGVCETMDLIHNTLGSAVGFITFQLSLRLFNNLNKFNSVYG